MILIIMRRYEGTKQLGLNLKPGQLLFDYESGTGENVHMTQTDLDHSSKCFQRLTDVI